MITKYRVDVNFFRTWNSKMAYILGFTFEGLLERLLIKQKFNETQIAKILRIDETTVYRWLEKTKIRMPVKKTRKIIVTKCPNCGREIKQPPNYFIKYCSSQCRITVRRKRKIVKCFVCGKKVYRAKWWFKLNKTPFCSRRCIREWQSMRLRMNLLPCSRETGRFLHSRDLNE